MRAHRHTPPRIHYLANARRGPLAHTRPPVIQAGHPQTRMRPARRDKQPPSCHARARRTGHWQEPGHWRAVLAGGMEESGFTPPPSPSLLSGFCPAALGSVPTGTWQGQPRGRQWLWGDSSPLSSPKRAGVWWQLRAQGLGQPVPNSVSGAAGASSGSLQRAVRWLTPRAGSG